MQSVWTRAASTRCTCRCRTCIRLSSTIARRAVGSGSPKSFQSLTSSTFWLSATFATAVVADGNIKANRKKRWERAIEDVKQELGRKEEAEDNADQIVDRRAEALINDTRGNTLSDKTANNRANAYPVATGLAKDEHTEPKPSGQNPDNPGKNEWLDGYVGLEALENLDTSLIGGYRPPWPVNSGPPLIVKHLPPQSLWSSDEYRRLNNERQWSPKKLMTMDISIACMLLEFQRYLLKMTTYRSSEKTLPQTMREYADLNEHTLNMCINNLLQDLKQVKRMASSTTGMDRLAGVIYPYYQQDSDGIHHEVTRSLNQSLLGLFRAYRSKKLSQEMLLLKISHNLLVSTAPPNLHTYNILLVAFASMNNHHLVDFAWNSFCETHMRPNEITCSTMLKQFTDRNDLQKFTNLIARMRGFGMGIMLAQPGVQITKQGAARLVRQDERPEKINQKVYATPMVFRQLMEGVLRFAGIEKALEICREMSTDGWALSTDSLNMFLTYCARKRDWKHGKLAWDAVREWARTHGSDGVSINAYGEYLALCQACYQREYFRSALNEAREKGYEMRAIKEAMMVAVAPLIRFRQDGSGIEKRNTNNLAESVVSESATPLSDAADADYSGCCVNTDSRTCKGVPELHRLSSIAEAPNDGDKTPIRAGSGLIEAAGASADAITSSDNLNDDADTGRLINASEEPHDHEKRSSSSSYSWGHFGPVFSKIRRYEPRSREEDVLHGLF